MGAQILIVLICRTEPKGTCTKQKKRDNYKEREEQNMTWTIVTIVKNNNNKTHFNWNKIFLNYKQT